MKAILYHVGLVISAIFLLVSCKSLINSKDTEKLKAEIIKTEKEFAETASKSGIQEAFYRFAADDAVINRANDSLISGKENIREFYGNPKYKNFDINWNPDFADVSNDGTLGYTYGKYELKLTGQNDSVTTYHGVFHTVWKRQADGSWKFVWD